MIIFVFKNLNLYAISRVWKAQSINEIYIIFEKNKKIKIIQIAIKSLILKKKEFKVSGEIDFLIKQQKNIDT